MGITYHRSATEIITRNRLTSVPPKMKAEGKDFVNLFPPQEERPLSAFNSGAARGSIFFRDQLSITTWLSLGAVAQGLLYFALGRPAFLPGATVILYRVAVAYLQATGWMHNPYMDGIIKQKTSAQFPDASGSYGSTPANNDVVVSSMVGAAFEDKAWMKILDQADINHSGSITMAEFRKAMA